MRNRSSDERVALLVGEYREGSLPSCELKDLAAERIAGPSSMHTRNAATHSVHSTRRWSRID